jgi:sugar phosphate isomerase/epimerase
MVPAIRHQGRHPLSWWLPFCGPPDVLAHLIKLGEGEFGLVLDTAWAMQIGPTHGNPVDWVQRFAGHITGLHLKDFVFNRDGSWTEMVVGDGNFNYVSFTPPWENCFRGFFRARI